MPIIPLGMMPFVQFAAGFVQDFQQGPLFRRRGLEKGGDVALGNNQAVAGGHGKVCVLASFLSLTYGPKI